MYNRHFAYNLCVGFAVISDSFVGVRTERKHGLDLILDILSSNVWSTLWRSLQLLLYLALMH